MENNLECGRSMQQSLKLMADLLSGDTRHHQAFKRLALGSCHAMLLHLALSFALTCNNSFPVFVASCHMHDDGPPVSESCNPNSACTKSHTLFLTQ